MTTEETKVLSTIKEVVNRLSPTGEETYTPEELAQEFAEEIVRLRWALTVARKTMKEAQQTLEGGGARFTWLDAPIDIADEALANNGSQTQPPKTKQL